VRVIPLDHDQLGHRGARDRLALARAPVAHLAQRLGDLIRRVVQQRRDHHVTPRSEMALGELGEALRDPPERVPVAL